MQTQTLVNASADVVTVQTLRPNDVYRRLGTGSYETDTVFYGVVTDVGFNGSQAFIAALEFNPNDYSGAVKPKTFGTSTDLNLFGCSPEEFRAAAADSRERFVRDINKKRAELEQSEAGLAVLEKMVSDSGSLRAPETITTARAAAEANAQ